MTAVADRYAWLDRATCLPYGEGWDRMVWQEQLDVCADCPVRAPCLANACELGIGGVRGGTLPTQRGVDQHGLAVGGNDTQPYLTMTDGRADRTLFDGLHAWWLEHRDNEHLPSIGPM